MAREITNKIVSRSAGDNAKFHVGIAGGAINYFVNSSVAAYTDKALTLARDTNHGFYVFCSILNTSGVVNMIIQLALCAGRFDMLFHLYLLAATARLGV
jgi:hypothetical protein